MSGSTAAARRRRAAGHGHAARSHAAPAPRRVSGPVARPRPVPARERTGTFERVLTLPEHRVVDRLLRGRAWIWLIGILLGGIVAMQVSLLKLNAGISRAVEASATLERQNSELEAAVAKLSDGARVRAAAANNGMVAPPAGAVEYLRADPAADVGDAVRRMRAPSAEAKALMANRGVTPAAESPNVATGTGTAATGAGTPTTTAGTTTAAPDATAGTTAAPATTGTTATPATTGAGAGTGGVTAAPATGGAAGTTPGTTTGATPGAATGGAAAGAGTAGAVAAPAGQG